MGVATIFIFRQKAGTMVKLASDNKDERDYIIDGMTKLIQNDVDHIKPKTDKWSYKLGLDAEMLIQSSSVSLLELLTNLSPNFDKSLPAYYIANIVTSIIINIPTQLQIALAVLLRNSKELVSTFYDFRGTCSYDELLRFKKSVAVAASGDLRLTGLPDGDAVLQCIIDNFDTDISSMNGKLSTHSLAMVMSKLTCTTENNNDTQSIRRVKKSEMSLDIDYDLDVVHYNGPKKPSMSESFADNRVEMDLVMQSRLEVSTRRAAELDLRFLIDVSTSESCPEYNGYMNKLNRENGHQPMPSTKAVYFPLIDMRPSDPTTIMTAMRRAQVISDSHGQHFTIMTADLQLYKVMINVLWTYPEQFQNFYPRLGGMHTLMSFAGCVGSLMESTGLTEILESTFGGVKKMLSGKKFPQNIRAMRMLAETMLRKVLTKSVLLSDPDELMAELEELTKVSPTTKLWCNASLKPVKIMMLFVRAEREANWLLHLRAVEMMVPYFFAARHVHYARYIIVYLKHMMNLPDEIYQRFLRGEHVTRHIAGLWTGIWSDMFIETTFMRYGKSKYSIIGITLKPSTLKMWALSLHVCGQLVNELVMLRNGECKTVQFTHKEESVSRIKSDAKDRETLRNKLDTVVDPMDPYTHNGKLLNIVTGMVSGDMVNVQDLVEIGEKTKNEFLLNLPDGFNNPISPKIVLMSVHKKSIQLGDQKIFDTDLIYARAMGLQASGRDVSVDEILSHELSPYPLSNFTERGEMRICKAKSTLKNSTKVEVSSRQVDKEVVSDIFIDGSALLWVINWPSETTIVPPTVKDFVVRFKDRLRIYDKRGNVFLVFDRYNDYSPKSFTRFNRSSSSRVYKLAIGTPLPSQSVTLTVTANKLQLMDIICNEIINDTYFHAELKHQLTITEADPTPFEIVGGKVIQRTDLTTYHEEADVIVVQQAVLSAKCNLRPVSVVADDTDIYVMLLHFYFQENLDGIMVMESPQIDRSVIDIRSSVIENRQILPSMLAAHALTGSDTSAMYYGIGKGKMLNILKSGVTLVNVGIVNASLKSVIDESMRFICACYGQRQASSMTEARIQCWKNKIGKSKRSAASAPSLKSLPPTNESFVENAKRAHYQACIWTSLLDHEVPDLDPCLFGWSKDDANKSLQPITVQTSVKVAPDSVLKLISDSPCKPNRCGCSSAKLGCTMFCSCQASAICENEFTQNDDYDDDDKHDLNINE